MRDLFKLPKVRVLDPKKQFDETLTCIDRSTFEHDMELNSVDQITFIAKSDGSIGYQLLTNENFIELEGQDYVIKISEKDDSGFDLKRNITATHIRFDAQYVYQYDKIKGQKTVSPSDLLNFVFDQNEVGNNGFTWEVQGNTSTVVVEDYGEVSGQDCINDCCEKFNMVITANNKHLKLIPLSDFVQKVDNSIRYLNNSSECQISIDTTEIQNVAKCYGKTKDKENPDDVIDGSPVVVPARSGICTVSTMKQYGAAVYSKPGDATTIIEYLPNGSSWQIDQKQTVNDKTWYRVSTNGWVCEDDIVFDKNGDQQPEDNELKHVSGKGHVKAANNSQDSDSPDPTSADLYNSPWTPQYIVRQLANGGQYLIDQEVDNGAQGKTWYRVATTEWIASDDMDFSAADDVVPKETETTDTGSSDGDGDDETEYYFQPFIAKDEQSISEWGLRAGPPITDERFTDAENMRQYALSAMKSEPDVTVTLTGLTNGNFQVGNMIFTEIRPENFQTWITVTAVKNNVLIWSDAPEITLNSSPQTLTDYEVSLQKSLMSVKANLQTMGQSLITTTGLANNSKQRR